jgi:UDP:flavonoid glycosyltransferase YjiC (YdhE family)
LPHVHVHIAAGFVDARLPLLPVGSRWVNAPAGLVDEFAAAGVAVVAGGMTMYEACALGTPTVAIPVVPAQRAAIEAAAEAGAVRTTPRKTPRDIARAVGLLIGNSSAAAAQAAVASRLVDGRGAERAAARLSELIDAAFTRGTRHAA